MEKNIKQGLFINHVTKFWKILTPFLPGVTPINTTTNALANTKANPLPFIQEHSPTLFFIAAVLKKLFFVVFYEIICLIE
jgi:hypothetical protein